MSTATARAYQPRFAGRLVPFEMQKSPQNKAFYGHLSTYSGKAHCIKDSVLLDPACGSGSLLLKVETVLGKEAVRNGYYDQEINITTYNLCRINMFLHDIGFDKFNVACEDTLMSPQHWDDEPFELIVSNPPYSIKWAGDENPLLINDPRFAPAGVLAPKSKAILHLSCTVFHGLHRMGQLLSYASQVLCIVVEQNRKFVSTWWIITLWTVSFSCQVICSLEQVLQPALWL